VRSVGQRLDTPDAGGTGNIMRHRDALVQCLDANFFLLMVVFVSLLCYCNMVVDELCFDRIPKSVRCYVRTEGGTGDDNSFFELRSKINTESMRRGIPRSINTSINCYLHREESGQPVQSLC